MLNYVISILIWEYMCRAGEFNLSSAVLVVQLTTPDDSDNTDLPENGNLQLKFDNVPKVQFCISHMT